MVEISALRNLGPESQRRLALVGIHDDRELAEAGSAAAYRRLRDAGIPGLSKTMLWALEGALLDVDWRCLPPQRKAELLAELDGPAAAAADSAG